MTESEATALVNEYTNAKILKLVPDFIERGEGVEELLEESELADQFTERAVCFHVYCLIKKGEGPMFDKWMEYRKAVELQSGDESDED